MYDIHSRRTSNMCRHIRLCHPERVPKPIRKCFTESETSQKVNSELSKMFATSNASAAIVNNKHFKNAINILNKSLPADEQVKIKSDKYFRDRVPELSFSEKQKIKEELKNYVIHDNYFAICVDESPIKGERYYAVELYVFSQEGEFHNFVLDFGVVDGNQDAQKVVEQIRRNLEFYAIPRIDFFIGDSAAYNSAAARILGVKWFKCIIHVLNLILCDAVKRIQTFKDLLKKLNKIREHFSRSLSDWKRLQILCRHKNSLKSYSRTRFSTAYCVMESFLLKYDGLRHFRYGDGKERQITDEEWAMMFKFCRMLKIFSEYSTFFSTTSTITRDSLRFGLMTLREKVKEIREELEHLDVGETIKLIWDNLNGSPVEPMNDDSLPEEQSDEIVDDDDFIFMAPSESVGTAEFWDVLQESMERRLGEHIDDDINLIANYLSPVLREAFMTEEEKERCREWIMEHFEDFEREDNIDLKSVLEKSIPFSRFNEEKINDFLNRMEEDDEWDVYERIVSHLRGSEFWSEKFNQQQFPTLFRMWKYVSVSPVSSIGVERIFSRANNLIGKRNGNTSSQLFSASVFLISSEKK